MDAKITLSFDAAVIAKAKKFADSHNMSLSRLTELLYKKMTSGNFISIEDFPISDWVSMVAEGPAEYKTSANRTRSKAKKEYFNSKK
jgi:hypothetical protein